MFVSITLPAASHNAIYRISDTLHTENANSLIGEEVFKIVQNHSENTISLRRNKFYFNGQGHIVLYSRLDIRIIVLSHSSLKITTLSTFFILSACESIANGVMRTNSSYIFHLNNITRL